MVIRDDDVMALATDSSWQKMLCCPRLVSNGPPSKVWMERMIFAVDGNTEFRRLKQKEANVRCIYIQQFFVSTKVARGAQR